MTDAQTIEQQPRPSRTGWWIAGGSAALLATAVGSAIVIDPGKFLDPEFIKDVGFPGAIAVFILSVFVWILYNFISWLRPQADALFARHIKLVDTVADKVVQGANIQERMAEHLQKNTELHQRIREDMSSMVSDQKRIAEVTERIEKHVASNRA